MKKLLALSVAFCLGVSTAALARSGSMGGIHHSSVNGGALGSTATAPGTNSSGTALSSSGGATGAMKGPTLGTGDPVVDREDARVAKLVQSICRGC